MKYLTIALVLAVSGCATYNGPKSNELISVCMQETRDMYLAGDCVESKLTKYYPDWRDDKKAYEVTMLTDLMRAKGLQVKDGIITQEEAYRDVMAYNNSKISQIKSDQAQQKNINAINSAAMIQAGAVLMTAPRTYAPPVYVPPYPADTTINVHQGQPYKFYDSRPYR